MGNIKLQIEEDIKEYQKKYEYIEKIKEDSWAFNYWILDKFFSIDEELIEEKIIDYKDLGIDAYDFNEDTKDLYLIQNKYFGEKTLLTEDYIKNNFLAQGITALENGDYNHCKKLQKIFTKNKKDSRFTVYLQLYVTNNKKTKKAENIIKKFNKDNLGKYIAKIYYLDDISEKYYEEINENKNDFQTKIQTLNVGLTLNTNMKEENNGINVANVVIPVISLYKLYKEVKEKNYSIFNNNVREYLGSKGMVNKGIYTTLMDDEERNNFLIYNNGITIICDEIVGIEKNKKNNIAIFDLKNPQIVNGCQTVSTIYEVLDNFEEEEQNENFSNTFVMLRILEIDGKNEDNKNLYENIVKYNNSQNPIDEKMFSENVKMFSRLQKEFMDKGFLLLVKKSDKYKFESEYKDKLSDFKKLNSERIEKFDLPQVKKINELFIEKDKLMQVILAFTMGGYSAYTKKTKINKVGTEEYKIIDNFIKKVTTNVLLDLYLLFKKSEQLKRKSDDKRTPISYYLIDGFAKFECKNRNSENIIGLLETKEKIEEIIHIYERATKYYCAQYNKKYKIEYNKMIKQEVEYEIFDDERERAVML